MVAGTQQETSNVGHGESDEGDRTAIGCGDSHQQSCREQQKKACEAYVYTQIFGIVSSEKQCIEGLYQTKTQKDADNVDTAEQWQA